MNLTTVLAIFLLVNEIVSERERFFVNNDESSAPLGLIKKRDSSKLELAVPLKESALYRGYPEYACDYSQDENGPLEDFLVACPMCPTNETCAIEEKWKKGNDVSEHTTLYFAKEYKSINTFCDEKGRPSIEKAQKKGENVRYCGQFEAEIYNVGFPVSNEDASDVQFISIYKICYSAVEGKGTQYTVHRIPSPSLLLWDVWEYYDTRRKNLHKCILDERDGSDQLRFVNRYAFEFVSFYDLPTAVWRSTTKFSFNYTPITRNKDVMIGMFKVDNYIRLYSRVTNKPLNLYSGTYQTTVEIGQVVCLPRFLCSKPTQIDSLWRIIMDDNGLATMIVTQHSEVKCVEESYICDADRIMVKKYKKGGCTYTCTVTAKVTKRLGLPSLKVNGILDLKLFSTDVSILDFFKKNITFEKALRKYNPSLASTMDFYSENDVENDKQKNESGGGGGGGGASSLLLPELRSVYNKK